MRRWLDLAIGLAAILVPAGLLLADQVMSAIPPYHHIKITPGLTGVTPPIDPEPTATRMLDGAWQADYARMIGSRTPLYPFAVRLKDQILFSVFGLSGIPAVLVGQGGSLIEGEYAREYCSRDLAAFTTLAKDWAPKIRQMQDAYERHGKIFLYVITPSKVAQYPDLLPSGYPCPAARADRERLLPLWRQYLTEAGVHFVDTTQVVAAAREQYPFAMYPRSGTHWNSVGAALAANAIAVGLDDPQLPPVALRWTMMARPVWPDTDLAQLMNLLREGPLDPVPQVALSAPEPPGGCRAVSIGIVGGSFMNRPAEYLAQGPCRPHVEEWQYWTVFDIHWPPGIDAKASVDPAARDRKLLAADVILYEENEQVAARSTQGPAFYGFLRRAWGFGPA